MLSQFPISSPDPDKKKHKTLLSIFIQFTWCFKIIYYHLKITVMGNLTSIEKQQKFFEHVTFIQQITDDNFGMIEIWRSKEAPYEYLMNYKRTFLHKDDTYLNHIELIKNLQGKNHKNIAKLYFFDETEQNQMCIKHIKVSTFFNYYNFSLGKALAKKKEMHCSFPQKELWYILLSLVDVGRFLKSNKISIGGYKLNKIFLTPEGFLKLYLVGITNQNLHNTYFQALCQLERIEKHLLSPEQLDCLVKGHETIMFDVYTSDVFSIGLIMLELMVLDEAKFYYNFEQFSLNFDKIKYALHNLHGIYSNQLINTVLACLQKSPAKRADFQTIYNYIENIKQKTPVSRSVRLNFDEQNKRQVSKPSSSQIKFPKNINQKLVVIPIKVKSDKSFSDSSSSFHKRKSNFTQSSSQSFYSKNFNY